MAELKSFAKKEAVLSGIIGMILLRYIFIMMVIFFFSTILKWIEMENKQ